MKPISPKRMIRYWFQLDNEIVCDGIEMRADMVPPPLSRAIRRDPANEVFAAFYEWHHLGHKTWAWVRPA